MEGGNHILGWGKAEKAKLWICMLSEDCYHGGFGHFAQEGVLL